MQDFVKANGLLRPCCAKPENLARVREKRDGRELRYQDTCRACGRNHYGIVVEPIKIGMAA